MASKSKEDVKKALRICALGGKNREHGFSCSDCPYRSEANKGTNCSEEMIKDLFYYLD